MSDTTITLTDDNKVEVLTSTLTTTGTLSYADFSSTISDKSTIKGVAIGNGVTQIADETFKACENLETLTFKETSSLTTIGNDAFLGCSKLSSSLTIPNSVTTIGTYAFSSCAKLEKVTMGNGVTNIGASAFSYCVKLATLDLGATEKIIGANAFAYCSLLTELTIPNSVKNSALNANAFADSSIATLNLGKSNQLGTSNKAQSAIESSEFFGKSNIRVIIIPIVTSMPITSAEQRVVYNYQITAEDVNGGSLNATAITPPSWLSFNTTTNVLSGTPLNANVGTSNNTVKIRVRDGELTTTQEFTITVSAEAPFKNKTALQTAIDKWYALANDGSATAVTKANNYEGSEYYGNPNTWDTSLITDLSYVFFKKDQDNHPDISTWNVSNVTTMQGTFSNSTFNGELKNWNVASVTDFSYCFANNVVFNQELKRWNVQDATTMESMFDNAYSFNQTIETPKGTLMMQYKDATKTFPTQLTWDETTINGYLTTIYGSATPQTNPTIFKGVFGIIALLKKTYLNALNTPKYNTIKSSFSEVISELTTNQLEIKKYNSTYDETDGWTETSPTIYFANTDGKTGDDLNDAKDKLNKLRLKTIVDGMLLINKAYDIAKNLGETDYSDLIEKMKRIYDNVYAELPFYVAWYAPLLTTKDKFLRNALTFNNGKEGTINQSLKDFIGTNPIKSINGKTYESANNVESSSADLFVNFKTAYNPQSE